MEVNEEGSEAAAVTAVVMKKRKRSVPVIRSFVTDHPFLFFIVDKRADFVLFMGHLVSPAPGVSQSKEEL